MSVAIIIAPILFKHSDLVLLTGGSSPSLWSFIVVAGTIFGAVVSPVFGAAADSTRSTLLKSFYILSDICDAVAGNHF
jgi:MFS-type transporter involved in bile tolerance (Atg22 family)